MEECFDFSKEPAKYEFHYEITDDQSGTQFGHQEQREGSKTQGEYKVLLPDGRKQIVQYEADGEGFRPQIRYEGRLTNPELLFA